MKLRILPLLGLLGLAASPSWAQAALDPLESAAPVVVPESAGQPRTPTPLATPDSAPVPGVAEAVAIMQTAPRPRTPVPVATPSAAPAQAAAPAAPAAPAVPRRPGQMINVRIDVTLTDSKGSPKVLTMTVADGETGMNRTTTVGDADYSFNADARPILVESKIRLSLTADAVVPVSAAEATAGGRTPRLALRQSQTVVLNNGESVEIARAADPTSDRSFALSVKVTILR